MQSHASTVFTATPNGVLMDGIPLAKAALNPLSSDVLRYVKRAEEMLATVTEEDWNNRTPHSTHDVPTLAKVQMLLALASPQPYPPLHKQARQELAKDDSDDADDEDEDEDDGSGGDSSSGDNASGDDSYSGSGNGHYNPDEPRIPAGQPGGGQWTTAGSVSTDSGSITADEIRTALTEGLNYPLSMPQGAQAADSGETTTENSTLTNTISDVNGNPVINTNTGLPYLLPSGMDIAANVTLAQNFAQNATDEEKDLAMVYWFRQGGPQDYQRPEGYIAATLGDIEMSHRDVTNYNYGAVAGAMGYSLQDALYYAGLHNTLVGNVNQPGLTAYNIQQTAVNNITQGYNDYHAGKWTNLSDLE